MVKKFVEEDHHGGQSITGNELMRRGRRDE